MRAQTNGISGMNKNTSLSDITLFLAKKPTRSLAIGDAIEKSNPMLIKIVEC
ncbi:hypothetical protein KDA_13440 [Dictyobacter alpinus]|uniref:Uncharacterized protein n=1 Tax=Dictyobacter alpinus TaxID=2014873 RepID=A0A402B3C3_9CHLR|nr:hypothetical protein KDA_13440 [Dictyobacter alpinus]